MPAQSLLKHSLGANATSVRESLAQTNLSLNDFANLISPAAKEMLETLSARSQKITQQRFDKVIRLFVSVTRSTTIR
jgi:2-iminoacetate synthase